MKKHLQKNGLLLGVIGLFSLFLFINFFHFFYAGPERYSYNLFRDKLTNNEIMDVTLCPEEGGTYLIKGRLKNDPKHVFETRAPIGSAVEQALNASSVKVEYEKLPNLPFWVNLVLPVLLPIVIMVIVILLFHNQIQGGSRGMSFNKIKASFGSGDDNKGRFADVAGADMEKTELLEIVDFLKDSRSYVKMGAKIPKGVLLVGPPGTGKTLLARAVAGEAGVPFLSISGSEFMEMFVGVGASRIRDLFEQAEKNSPCIIFIDEIDAVGRHRGAGLGGGHDEREQTLNQLLVEMDGFNVNKGIIVMAATNRADILDPALLRPGRFDRQITVSLPTVNARHEILKVHAKNKPLTNEVDLKAIAERTTGFSGADLASVLNEAALLAARFNKSAITTSEIDEAIDRVLMGPAKKGMVVSSNELKMIAYHEAGHVVLGYYLGEDAVVHKVTIVPRKDAAGYAMIGPKEDRIITTKRELLNQITGLLGGRVAEKLVFNESSTGASKDFEMATGIARAMITEYGMSDKLATMLYGDTREQVFLGRDLGSRKNCSDQIAYEIDMEMQQIMRDCYRAAETLIKKHRNKLDLIATELLARETLVREQIIELMKYGKLAVTDEKNTKEKNKDDLDDVKVNIQKKDIKELDEQANKDDNK